MGPEKKAQAGLEYLMAYSWALIAIATIVAVLIFATGGGINTNTCTTFLALVCKGIGVDGDTMVMVLQNATGQKISINPFEDICFDGICGYARIDYKGTTYRFESVEIPAGAQFKILAAGQVLANEISITYTEKQTGLEKTVTSTIGTEAPNNTEISNDGIDNDGDGFVDCAQAGIGPCEYVVENGTASSNSITAGDTDGETITFTSPTISGGGWLINGGTIGFYVTSGAGASAEAKFADDPDWHSDGTLGTGWNYIDVSMVTPSELPSEPQIQLKVTGSDVTISDAEGQKPKAVITLIVG